MRSIATWRSISLSSSRSQEISCLGATQQQLVATGFHCNTITDEVAGNGNPEVARLEAVVDRVNTTGAVFLGLTLGCAQCHSHKFDPISMRDYYQLLAFFNDADCSVLEFAPAAEIARRDATQSQLETLRTELKAYEKTLHERFVGWEQGFTQASRAELKPEIRTILEPPKTRGVRSRNRRSRILQIPRPWLSTTAEHHRGTHSIRAEVGLDTGD